MRSLEKSKCIAGVAAHSVGEYYPFTVYAMGEGDSYLWYVQGPGVDTGKTGFGFVSSRQAEDYARYQCARYCEKRGAKHG